jgi:hypothetical protein
MDIWADTPGAPGVIKFRGSAVVASLNGIDQGPAHFNIDSIRKDLRAMMAEEGHGLRVAYGKCHHGGI